MGMDLNDIPPKVKIIFLKGQQAAIERLCRKLEVEARDLQEAIDQIKAEVVTD